MLLFCVASERVLKIVALRLPVDGLKYNFVDDTYDTVSGPAIWEAMLGYSVVFVVVSSWTMVSGISSLPKTIAAVIGSIPEYPLVPIGWRISVSLNVVM